jgi:hypothetical protein
MKNIMVFFIPSSKINIRLCTAETLELASTSLEVYTDDSIHKYYIVCVKGNQQRATNKSFETNEY